MFFFACFFAYSYSKAAQNRARSDRIRTAISSAVISRPGGEIGRHKRLKISRLYGRAGSIPAPGTKFRFKINAYVLKASAL